MISNQCANTVWLSEWCKIQHFKILFIFNIYSSIFNICVYSSLIFIHVQHLYLCKIQHLYLYSTVTFVPRGGGTCQNFDRDASPIFLGLKFGQILFFWVGKFFSYFSGFRKISAIFLGLTNFQLFFWVFQFLYHTLESFK